MKYYVVWLWALLAVSGQALGQSWPPTAEAHKTVFIISHLKGKAYLRRDNKLYAIETFDCDQRASKNKRPIRLAIIDNDRFWLEKGAKARACFLSESGNMTPEQQIMKGYTKVDTRYNVNYDELTPEQYRQIRLMLCSGANSKPLTDLSHAGLALPIENGLVRASMIPYWFWQAQGVKTAQVSIVYELSDGEIVLGQWRTNGQHKGSISVDRTSLVAKLRKHFGRDDGWETRPIPVKLRLTDSNGKDYALSVLLADDASCKLMEEKLSLLAQTLRETPGDSRDFKVSELVAKTGDFRSETLFLLAQSKSNSTHRMLLTTVAEDEGIEPKALLDGKKRD